MGADRSQQRLKEYIVDERLAGKRLDAALEALMPGSGLRARRRHVNCGLVTVNGRAATPGRKVRTGDRLLCRHPKPESGVRCRLLGTAGDFYCFWKPAGIHTAALAGKQCESLEEELPLILTDLNNMPTLLQRLDYGTSGLVLGAVSDKAFNDFRQFEKTGKCKKFYLALLEGKLERALMVNRALDVDNRKKTRVLESEGERVTFFEPLGIFDAKVLPASFSVESSFCTLTRCVLQAGSRHQIRAHAAWLGHPLAGDQLYGHAERQNFYLEHYRLEFPEHFFQMSSELSRFRDFASFYHIVRQYYA